MEEYNEIVNDWYVKLRDLFLNYIHKHIPGLRIEDIEDIYSETFIAVRENMLNNRVKEGTKWKSYIFQIGYNMAINRMKQEGKKMEIIDNSNDDDIDADRKFETQISLMDLINEDDDKEQLEKRIETLKREIRYLPEPCETILKDFYFGGFSMTEIMYEINYKTADSVKARKNKCMNQLKERVKVAFKMLNLID
ncbi:MAG: sigma-70 family RNA polymerase sigma factor [Muribaculaceae bacterium]|nr:sigma-70 family RNA polymerase sigma factor [Muribaculaceae bacterium]